MDRAMTSRMRWRMRGAWLWPAFVVLTVLDGLIVHARPLGGQGTGLVPALLLSGFINLGAVALIGPVAARLLRRRRRDLPQIVALDYAGTALLALVLAAVIIVGELHHGDVTRERRATVFAAATARDYVARHGPREYRRAGGVSDTLRVDPGKLYRTCVSGPDPARPFCVVVHLDTQPPRLVKDGYEPNASWAPVHGGY
jgi:hypothetical protein